jgi:aerobic carbon-monoxide dehydrogenase small subunit
MALRMARPAHLIDINDIAELARMTVIDGVLRIGACLRHAAFAIGTLPGAGALLRKVVRHTARYRTRPGFEEFSSREGEFAIAMAVVSYRLDKGVRAEPRLAIGGAKPPPRRVTSTEHVLCGRAAGAQVFAEAGKAVAATTDPMREIKNSPGRTGTRIGCEHGVCGACTVLVDDEPGGSGLTFAAEADGRSIRTVEGLQQGDRPHPMQEAFTRHHALQCGFCTPGFLMLAVGVLKKRPDVDEEEAIDILSSNLCCCAGYANNALVDAAADMKARA